MRIPGLWIRYFLLAILPLLSQQSCKKNTLQESTNEQKLDLSNCPRIAALQNPRKEDVYKVSTFAGTNGQAGNIDGPLCDATFNNPYSLAIAADGTIYIADGPSIRKISIDGMVSTLASNNTVGIYDDVDIAKNGSIYIQDDLLDEELAGFIQILSASGKIDTLGYFGGCCTMTIGPDHALYQRHQWMGIILRIEGSTVTPYIGQEAQLGYVTGLAFNKDGIMYIAESTRIRKRTPDGHLVNFVGGENGGFKDGKGSEAAFIGIPFGGLVIADDGSLYVSDGPTIRRIDPAGNVVTIAGDPNTRGNKDGAGKQARFNSPRGLLIHQGYLYVADTGNHLIKRIKIE